VPFSGFIGGKLWLSLPANFWIVVISLQTDYGLLLNDKLLTKAIKSQVINTAAIFKYR
jgi:hypothetical protein